MSHVVITCTCKSIRGVIVGDCPVPGHGTVPLEVDPWTLVSAGEEALGHLRQAMESIISARAAWVSRGFPGDNSFPLACDREAMKLMASCDSMRRWVQGARTVAERRAS